MTLWRDMLLRYLATCEHRKWPGHLNQNKNMVENGRNGSASARLLDFWLCKRKQNPYQRWLKSLHFKNRYLNVASWSTKEALLYFNIFFLVPTVFISRKILGKDSGNWLNTKAQCSFPFVSAWERKNLERQQLKNDKLVLICPTLPWHLKASLSILEEFRMLL